MNEQISDCNNKKYSILILFVAINYSETIFEDKIYPITSYPKIERKFGSSIILG
jgi:hypothetical protein